MSQMTRERIMGESEQKMLDPYKTMCICYHDGKEVGRIPATAPNAVTYIDELVGHYGSLNVEYVEDENAGFLALLHGPAR